MRGLTDAEREYMLTMEPCSIESCVHDEEISTEELVISERLTKRGLLVEVECESDVRPIDDDWVEISFHDALTPAGKYVLELDRLARSVCE